MASAEEVSPQPGRPSGRPSSLEATMTDDHRTLLQLALALIGAATLLGSTIGAAVGWWTAGEVEAE
jgi:hypothetical protein